jgi:hypothetical protein
MHIKIMGTNINVVLTASTTPSSCVKMERQGEKRPDRWEQGT